MAFKSLQVAFIYRHASLGVSINIIVVRLIILNKKQQVCLRFNKFFFI